MTCAIVYAHPEPKDRFKCALKDRAVDALQRRRARSRSGPLDAEEFIPSPDETTSLRTGGSERFHYETETTGFAARQARLPMTSGATDSVMPAAAVSGGGGDRVPARSAVTTFARSVTVAAGVFGPGHLGELTRQVPFELVDPVLAQTRTTERRLRALPSRWGCISFWRRLFSRVWGTRRCGPNWSPASTAGRRCRARRCAICAAGSGPRRCRRCSRCWPGRWPSPPRRGSASADTGRCPSTATPRSRCPTPTGIGPGLGKMRAANGVTGYPAIELMTLVETGTRALLGAVFGPIATGETDYARRLLPLLNEEMLVLADRGFDAADFVAEVAGTSAAFLVRVRSTRRLPVLARCDDGSYLSRIGNLSVRIITADITVTCADDTRYSAHYRLATTVRRTIRCHQAARAQHHGGPYRRDGVRAPRRRQHLRPRRGRHRMPVGAGAGLRTAEPGGVQLGHQRALADRDRPRQDQRGGGPLHRRIRRPDPGRARASQPRTPRRGLGSRPRRGRARRRVAAVPAALHRCRREGAALMAPITTSIDVDRPPGQVFAYVTDPSRFVEWQTECGRGHLDGGGTRRSARNVLPPPYRFRRAPVTSELTLSTHRGLGVCTARRPDPCRRGCDRRSLDQDTAPG